MIKHKHSVVDGQGLDTVYLSMWGELKQDICSAARFMTLRSQRSSKRVNTGFQDQKQCVGGKSNRLEK